MSGFYVKTRQSRYGKQSESMEGQEEAGDDSKPKKKRRNVKRKSELELSFPDYIQVFYSDLF